MYLEPRYHIQAQVNITDNDLNALGRYVGTCVDASYLCIYGVYNL
jgi:hypothetical protein